jgi:hypothetical protein
LDTTESNLEELRQRLRRIAGDVSPRVIAEKSGVSHATIYRWLSDDPLTGTYRTTVTSLRRFVETWEAESSRGVSHETPADKKPDRGSETPGDYRISPRVSAGLPYRLRVWLQTELTEYAKAGISDADFVDARSALESPEVIGFFMGGGGGGEQSEEDVLEEMKLMARAIRRRLRRGGAKIGPDPVP